MRNLILTSAYVMLGQGVAHLLIASGMSKADVATGAILFSAAAAILVFP